LCIIGEPGGDGSEADETDEAEDDGPEHGRDPGSMIQRQIVKNKWLNSEHYKNQFNI
jgi:hypothetical protein